jgi:hypothetical protein
MYRYTVAAALAALVLAPPAEAKRIAIHYTPIQKLARADAVVVGKVGSVEKATVAAAPFPESADKVDYKVAVIKIETGLAGAAGVTHVKVGFLPPPVDPAAPVRGGVRPVALAEGDEGVYFLTKHHTGAFYTISPAMAPALTAAADYKDQLALLKKGAAVLAEPAKALEAGKAEDRTFAAVVLVTKYRTYPESGGEVETVKVAADESRAALKALAEADWAPNPADRNAPNPFQAFGQIGLTDKDGWRQPVVKPGEDFVAKSREAFAEWVAGAGKDYRINKIVPKK